MNRYRPRQRMCIALIAQFPSSVDIIQKNRYEKWKCLVLGIPSRKFAHLWFDSRHAYAQKMVYNWVFLSPFCSWLRIKNRSFVIILTNNGFNHPYFFIILISQGSGMGCSVRAVTWDYEQTPITWNTRKNLSKLNESNIWYELSTLYANCSLIDSSLILWILLNRIYM